MDRHPSLSSSLFSDIFLTWVAPLLTAAAPPPLHPADAAAPLCARLTAAWAAEASRAAAAHTPPAFARAWAAAFLPAFAPVGLATWAKALLALAQSRLVLMLLDVVARPERSAWEGLGLAAAVGALGVGAALADAWYWRQTWFHGHRWRVATLGLLHGKALRLRSDALRGVSTGHVVSLASNDVETFLQVVHHLPHLVLTPIDFCLYAWCLYSDLGVSAFAGLGLMVAISAAQLLLYARTYGALRRARSATTDERLDLTSQMIGGIRVIKSNGWEPPFYAAAARVRASEVAQLQAQYRVRGTFEGLIHCKYLLLSGASILCLWALGEAITPARVYSASALFYLLEMDRVWRFVENAENISSWRVSLQRFEAFLALPEVPQSPADAAQAAAAGAAAAAAAGATALAVGKAAATPGEGEALPLLQQQPAAAVAAASTAAPPSDEGGAPPDGLAGEVEGLRGGWLAGEGSGEGGAAGAPARLTEVLRGVSMRVARGELCAVVGATGAGKTSLLLALLGELPTTAGRALLRGVVSYSPQQPFLMSDTVAANVAFGRALEPQRLREVLEACALSGEVAPGTRVGERGVTLSGGQRARLGLARALYAKADVYLLDDPLSALDAAVGRAVFERALRGPLLAGAAVVLVTHQLHFLRRADSICVMGAGACLMQGAFSSLSGQLEALASAAGAEGGAGEGAGAGAASPPLLVAALTRLLEQWGAAGGGAGEGAPPPCDHPSTPLAPPVPPAAAEDGAGSEGEGAAVAAGAGGEGDGALSGGRRPRRGVRLRVPHLRRLLVEQQRRRAGHGAGGGRVCGRHGGFSPGGRGARGLGGAAPGAAAGGRARARLRRSARRGSGADHGAARGLRHAHGGRGRRAAQPRVPGRACRAACLFRRAPRGLRAEPLLQGRAGD